MVCFPYKTGTCDITDFCLLTKAAKIGYTNRKAHTLHTCGLLFFYFSFILTKQHQLQKIIQKIC